MNNQWHTCHLQMATAFLLRKMIHKAYCTLNPELTHDERVEEMNILAAIVSKDALMAKGAQVLALLERRKMCCLDLPPVPYVPLSWCHPRKRRFA